MGKIIRIQRLNTQVNEHTAIQVIGTFLLVTNRHTGIKRQSKNEATAMSEIQFKKTGI